jgi:hypothetical protein
MEQKRKLKNRSHNWPDQVIFDKGVKAIQGGKDSLFNKWYLNEWISIWKNKQKKNLSGLPLYTNYSHFLWTVWACPLDSWPLLHPTHHPIVHFMLTTLEWDQNYQGPWQSALSSQAFPQSHLCSNVFSPFHHINCFLKRLCIYFWPNLSPALYTYIHTYVVCVCITQ